MSSDSRSLYRKVHIRPAEVRDIQAFAPLSDRNLKHQGFVGAAEAQMVVETMTQGRSLWRSQL